MSDSRTTKSQLSQNLFHRFMVLKNQLSQNQILIPDRIHHQVQIKVVNASHEMSEVIQFLKEYHRPGLQQTVQNLLPSTSWITMKCKGQLMGVCNIIADSGMGMPHEDINSMMQLRSQVSRLGMVNEFFIDQRNSDQSSILWLFKYLMIYCLKQKKFDVILLNSENKQLLKVGSLMGFPMWQKYIAIERSLWRESVLSKTLVRDEYQKSLVEFLVRPEPALNFTFPEREFFCSNDPSLGPSLLETQLQSSGLIKTLNENEKLIIKNAYPAQVYNEVLPTLEHTPEWIDLRALRSESFAQAFELNVNKDFEIIKASKTGLLLHCQSMDAIKIPRDLKLKCHVGLGHFSEVDARMVSRIGKNLLGVELSKSDRIWKQLTEFALKPFLQLS